MNSQWLFNCRVLVGFVFNTAILNASMLVTNKSQSVDGTWEVMDQKLTICSPLLRLWVHSRSIRASLRRQCTLNAGHGRDTFCDRKHPCRVVVWEAFGLVGEMWDQDWDQDLLDVPHAPRLFGRGFGSGHTLDVLRLALPELFAGTPMPSGESRDRSLSSNLIRFVCCLSKSPILLMKWFPFYS